MMTLYYSYESGPVTMRWLRWIGCRTEYWLEAGLYGGYSLVDLDECYYIAVGARIPWSLLHFTPLEKG